MGVLNTGRKISAQFFPRTLIEMPYNKTFGCIIVQKSVQTTFIQLMTLKLVSKNYLEVTCDFHPFPIELTAWGKKNNRGYKVKRIEMAVEVDGHFSTACEQSL